MKTFFSAELRRVRSSTLAHNAGWMLVGQGLNLVLQAGYFILLARVLGVKEYGIFVGAFAFVSLASPYSALGSGFLFMQYVHSGSDNFAAYWGNILLSTVGMGSLIAAVLYLVAPHLLNPASASVTLLVALAECTCRQLAICIGQMFQAFEKLHMTAVMNLLTSSLRLLAVAALQLFLHHASAQQWAAASLGVSVLAAVTGSVIILVRFGRPHFVPRILVSKFGEGLNFCLGGSTKFVYDDIDKTMLSHYGMNVANGIYTMAYRIIDLATIPVTALDAAALPRYFRHDDLDAKGVKTLSYRLAWRAALVGLVTSGCALFAVPLIPSILGRGFSSTVDAYRWLCLIPAFRGIHQLTGSAATGLGFQHYRTRTQIAAAALNFGLNLWLIPRYSWHGAAWASLATDGSLAIANCIILRNLQHRISAKTVEV